VVELMPAAPAGGVGAGGPRVVAPGALERPVPPPRAPRAFSTWLIAAGSFLALGAVIVALQIRGSGGNTAELGAVAAVLTPAVSPPAAPAATASAAETAPAGPRPIRAEIRATDAVWLAVEADGHPLF